MSARRLPRIAFAALAMAIEGCAPTTPSPSRPEPRASPSSAGPAEPADAAPASLAQAGLAELRRGAAALRPIAGSDIARRFLDAVSELPPESPRGVYCDRGRSRCVTAAELARLDADAGALLSRIDGDASFYYATRYETPLSYLTALDVLAAAGDGDLRGKRVLDYGYGMIGQLRLFALLGATVTGIDVDPMLPALYGRPTDQGPIGRGGGKVSLVNADFPKDEAARALIAGPYDILLSKNTLKRGYVHPAEPVPPGKRIDPGVDDATFVRLLHERVAARGLLLIYNICPAPAPPGKPYIPWADGRSPFARATLEDGGFDVLEFDHDDTARVRLMARALGWDRGEDATDIDHDLFALYTLARRRP